jgi:predicted SAM-dependent methyltransferase
MTSTSSLFVQQHIQKWKKLKQLIDTPDEYLDYQNTSLYQETPEVNSKTPKVESRKIRFPSLSDMSDVEPRVLNIHNEENSQHENLAAVDVAISPLRESPTLKFDDGHFTVIRVAHVLQTIPYDNIFAYLSEWKRILHANGELHISIPNAEIILNELINTTEEKIEDHQADELLSQVYGSRPGMNRVLYSYKLLEDTLHKAGFTRVEVRKKEQDLAFQCDIDDDSQSPYSLMITAGFLKTPHRQDMVLGEKSFRDKCAQFVEQYPTNPSATYIIAVYNEEKNLPHFLSFLESSHNETNTKREFIFVLNGCTDESEKVIRQYTKESLLRTKIVHSDIGIVTAFIKGIEVRELDGFIGKIDSDVMLHPHLLDLMQIHLVENDQAQVTYAEPMPSDSQTAYNEPDFNPSIATKRLYYTSKTSLNRVDPFARTAIRNILQNFKAEDMFLSFYFIYFYGLQSISRTPHGHTYAKTVGNFEDLVRQMSRMNSEMKREFGSYPPFGILDSVTEQEFFPGDYKDTYQRAQKESDYVSEWTRIMSTK